uniref:Uncharacterized protein n=1 Tax=Arundo donax TaxID=35708 RepID=A0A0A8ZW84_ARUDO
MDLEMQRNIATRGHHQSADGQGTWCH